MTEADLVLGWARAFALTLVVETAVVAPLLRRHVPAIPHRLGVIALAQLTTHPIVWFVLPALIGHRAAFLLIAEAWACAGEAVVYVLTIPSLGPRAALLVSLTANAASLAAGLALRGAGVAV